jgi:hypothetical protein
VHIILFVLFSSYFFLLGRGAILLINKVFKIKLLDDNSKIFETSLIVFYPLLGLIIFGNYMFLVNFFFPINNLLILPTISIMLLCNFYEKINLYSNIKIYAISLINTIILSISSYDINFQYDAGYYHLNYQNWLREFKLVPGLNNLNAAFGTSSIVDYISAPLWLKDNLILLHYITILFLGIFVNFVFYHLIVSRNNYFLFTSFIVIVYGLLDNFGIGGGRNGFFTIHGIIKPDIASSVLFYLNSIFCTYILISKKFNKIDLILLNIFIIFAFQLKISSSLLFIYFMYVLIKSQKLTFRNLIFTNLILALWLVKSLLLTSCLLYPVEITCINLPWFNLDAISGIKNVTGEFNNSYLLGNSVTEWFNDWILIEINRTIIYNFFISFFVLTIVKHLLTVKMSESKKGYIVIPIAFVVMNYLIWIVGAAHPRFIYGLFAFTVSLLFLDFQNRKLRFKINSNINLILLGFGIFTVLLIPRINSYKAFIDDPFKSPSIKPDIVEYIDLRDNWVLPLSGDQCWVNLNCIPYDKNIKKEQFVNYFTYVVNR